MGGSGGTGAPGSTLGGFSSVSHLGADSGRPAIMRACEADYMSLRFDVYSPFTGDENLEFKNRNKFHASALVSAGGNDHNLAAPQFPRNCGAIRL
jgi:hypothetical protein